MGTTLFWTFYTAPDEVEGRSKDPRKVFGFCGDGVSYQARIMESDALVEGADERAFRLLITPKKGKPGHWRELEQLAEETNRFFATRAAQALRSKREASGRHDLELTVALGRQGLELVYALPAARKKGSYPQRAAAAKPRTVRKAKKPAGRKRLAKARAR